ncbi:hypothetical protein IFR04_009176 [Cadophora malorum]|uniref:Uncharacterized protein n=1 Tax=Cadophora malorum TaxID=108018 RepID=A0A8H7W9J8_9HELO|nr:hypothetical protein IFR04_009176 [Cadophora malorum]
MYQLPTNPQLTLVTAVEPDSSASPVSGPTSTTSTSKDSDMAETSSISMAESSQTQLTTEVLVIRKRNNWSSSEGTERISQRGDTSEGEKYVRNESIFRQGGRDASHTS